MSFKKSQRTLELEKTLEEKKVILKESEEALKKMKAKKANQPKR